MGDVWAPTVRYGAHNAHASEMYAQTMCTMCIRAVCLSERGAYSVFYEHFLRLQRVKNEYDDLARAVPIGQGFLTFYDYVKEYYGVKLQSDGDNVSLAYSVVDEKKYTMFLLKFNR